MYKKLTHVFEERERGGHMEPLPISLEYKIDGWMNIIQNEEPE